MPERSKDQQTDAEKADAEAAKQAVEEAEAKRKWDEEHPEMQEEAIFADAKAKERAEIYARQQAREGKKTRADLPELEKKRQKKAKEVEDDQKENTAENPLAEPYGTTELSEEYEAKRVPYAAAGTNRCPNCGAVLAYDEATGLLHV